MELQIKIIMFTLIILLDLDISSFRTVYGNLDKSLLRAALFWKLAKAFNEFKHIHKFIPFKHDLLTQKTLEIWDEQNEKCLVMQLLK